MKNKMNSKTLFLRAGILLLAVVILMCATSALDEETLIVSNETEYPDLGLTCKSAVLMEASSGKILYAKNPDEALPPASVTKVMTLLLTMEAIDDGRLSLDDMITASAHAASMGGSQIYLKEGETMSAEDLIKSVVIASANDAAVALAEHIAGSESAFVDRMNQRAGELGMENTHFENTNGLDDTVENHLTSAKDIAIMSRELIRHRKILEYSSIWMDTIRDGSFGLTNTNRLVRFYNGATGLKTGSTSKAKFCISATALRDGMDLICVIMGAETRDIRNEEAKKLLDWGYANYELFTYEAAELGDVCVTGGKENKCAVGSAGFSCVVGKGEKTKIKAEISLPETLSASVKKGDKVGEIRFTNGGECIGKAEICSRTDVEKIGYFDVLLRIIRQFLLA